jgi:hypothetical protein
MPGQPFSTDHLSPTAAPTAQASTDPTAQRQLSRDQVERWATLIANGETEFPSDLPAIDQEELLRNVRRLLRSRMVAFVARAIALDLRRDASDENREARND